MKYLLTGLDPKVWKQFKLLCMKMENKPASVRLREFIEAYVNKYKKED